MYLQRNLAHTFKEQALDLLVVSAEPAAAEGQRVIHATSSTSMLLDLYSPRTSDNDWTYFLVPAKRSADGDLDEEDECNRASTSNVETTRYRNKKRHIHFLFSFNVCLFVPAVTPKPTTYHRHPAIQKNFLWVLFHRMFVHPLHLTGWSSTPSTYLGNFMSINCSSWIV